MSEESERIVNRKIMEAVRATRDNDLMIKLIKLYNSENGFWSDYADWLEGERDYEEIYREFVDIVVTYNRENKFYTENKDTPGW